MKIGLYLHIPFCKKKCAYCDFNSYQIKKEIQKKYVESLISEVRFYKKSSLLVETIYFGGGTPTTLPLADLGKIMKTIKNTHKVSDDVEVSIEANPDGLKTEYLSGLKKIGFNRISLGIQSFDPKILKVLGRNHSVENSLKAFKQIRKAGFDNINIDLIYGTPGETVESWKKTVRKAVFLQPTHISIYPLTLERHVKLKRDIEKGIYSRIDEDDQADKYLLAVDILKKSSFKRYEISNFSLPGYECAHNLLYWKNKNYLGVGAGAHSFYKKTRFSNFYFPLNYIKAVERRGHGIKKGYREILSESIKQEMILNLRLDEGVELGKIEKKFGIDVKKWKQKEFEFLRNNGLIKGGKRIKLSEKGVLLANEVFVRMI
ncbi:MAG: radical SAM family heme chaperone HemW [Actinomycetia bacterium]|nr:radical SAM family heme chaperone HemW [Actinomycetes bacterium]